MADEFEGDLRGSVFWGADLGGARFRDVDLTGARISHSWLADVEVDAFVDRLVVNGVDVTAYVNEGDRWYPLRSMIRATTAEAMAEAWAALEAEWAATVARAVAVEEARGEAALHEQVDGEWSFVETVRHIVFAIDKWFTVPVLGEGFHPMGLPNSGSVDYPWPGLQPDLSPSAAEALAVRDERAGLIGAYLSSVAPADLDGEVDVLENGPNPRRLCVQVVFEEEFWHNRYAARDLATF